MGEHNSKSQYGQRNHHESIVQHEAITSLTRIRFKSTCSGSNEAAITKCATNTRNRQECDGSKSCDSTKFICRDNQSEAFFGTQPTRWLIQTLNTDCIAHYMPKSPNTIIRSHQGLFTEFSLITIPSLNFLVQMPQTLFAILVCKRALIRRRPR